MVRYGGIEVNRNANEKWKSSIDKIGKIESNKKRASYKGKKEWYIIYCNYSKLLNNSLDALSYLEL